MQLFVTPWTIGHQALLSMEFSRQEYWEWAAMPSSRGSLQSRDWNPCLLHCRQILYRVIQGLHQNTVFDILGNCMPEELILALQSPSEAGPMFYLGVGGLSYSCFSPSWKLWKAAQGQKCLWICYPLLWPSDFSRPHRGVPQLVYPSALLLCPHKHSMKVYGRELCLPGILKACVRGFPGGSVVQNPLTNTGDKGSIPGPGRSHMP